MNIINVTKRKAFQSALQTLHYEEYSLNDIDDKGYSFSHLSKPIALKAKFQHPVVSEGSFAQPSSLSPKMAQYAKDKETQVHTMHNPSYFLTEPVSFAVEKEFRRLHGQDRILAWERASRNCDPSLQSIVEAINYLNFAYTSGWSESGHPDENSKQLGNGYVVFTADNTDRAQQFIDQVDSLEDVCIRPFLPDSHFPPRLRDDFSRDQYLLFFGFDEGDVLSDCYQKLTDDFVTIANSFYTR